MESQAFIINALKESVAGKKNVFEKIVKQYLSKEPLAFCNHWQNIYIYRFHITGDVKTWF